MADASVLRPSNLAHVVFRTANFPAMLEFWSVFLGAEIVFSSDFIAFLRFDEEHHRVAIIKEPDTVRRVDNAAGLHHVSFGYSSLLALLRAYKAREGQGIKATWCVNHGPTTSIYYKDPDGNAIETQVDNYETVEEANEFMRSKYFEENPIGSDIDAHELLALLEKGADEKSLLQRVEIGARVDIPAGV